jgi:RinA family phage transcriptional activator
LHKGIIKYIEYELYNYEKTKKEMAELEDDVIFAARPAFDETVTTNRHRISKPTEEKAIRLVSSAYFQRCRKVISAIDKALETGGPEFKALFEHHFIKHKSWQTSELDLFISQSTYFRRQRQLYTLVALQLGLINP